MANLICTLLPFMFNVFHSSSTFLVQEAASKKKKTRRINLINMWLVLISSLLKYFTALFYETTYFKD